MNYIISIIPILLYLLGIKALDAMSFTNWKRLITCIMVGAASCGVAFVLLHQTHEKPYYVPLMEELLKALFIIKLVVNGSTRHSVNKGVSGLFDFSIAFFAEAMVYGMAVGAGFAMVENVLYVFYNYDITTLHCIMRGFGTALLHMGCTALVATMLVVFSRMRQGKDKSFLTILGFEIGIVVALLVAVAIHTVYNLFLLPALIQLLVTVVVFVVLFMYLYMVEERLISKWLDVSISDDIKLLGAIKDGNLATTRAGEYLVTVRESFQPEVFFDMLVFLQLYLELSIKAKSRLIAREAGLTMPISNTEHREDIQRVKELSTLRNNIGRAGLTVLSPLIHVRNADKWVINELL